LSPAHGRAGARATLLSFSHSVPPPSEKMLSGFQQAGKKEGGLGEGIFARLLSAPKARQGWEAARPCVSKEAKPAKIVSLIEKEFCARPLKKRNFCGLCPPSGGEPLGRVSARQGRNSCSKWVRTSFSNCDQLKHCEFCGQFVCSLAPPAAGLRSHFSVYFGTKSNGRTKSKISFLSSRRRFGAAKPPEQKHTIKKIIEMFLLSNFSVCRFAALRSQFFNPALFPPKAEWPKATY